MLQLFIRFPVLVEFAEIPFYLGKTPLTRYYTQFSDVCHFVKMKVQLVSETSGIPGVGWNLPKYVCAAVLEVLISDKQSSTNKYQAY